jgi:hypothetical protein
MPALVSAYLTYKSNMAMNVERGSTDCHIFEIDILGIRGKSPHYIHELQEINLPHAEHDSHRNITQNNDEEANIALIRQGCLGSSPFQPTIAFTLEALEFYHQLQ